MKKLFLLLLATAFVALSADAMVFKGKVTSNNFCDDNDNCSGWQDPQAATYVTIDDKNASSGGYVKITMGKQVMTFKIVGTGETFYDEDGWCANTMTLVYQGEYAEGSIRINPNDMNQFMIDLSFNGGYAAFMCKKQN